MFDMPGVGVAVFIIGIILLVLILTSVLAINLWWAIGCLIAGALLTMLA